MLLVAKSLIIQSSLMPWKLAFFMALINVDRARGLSGNLRRVSSSWRFGRRRLVIVHGWMEAGHVHAWLVGGLFGGLLWVAMIHSRCWSYGRPCWEALMILECTV